jgi:DNA-binding NtrC family response regulator
MTARATARRTREGLAALVKAIDRPAFVVGPDCEVLAANAAYERAFAGADRVVGRHCHELTHGRPTPECLGVGLCPLARVRQSGSALRTVHLHRTPEGEVHTVVRVQPLEDRGARGRHLFVFEPVAEASARPSLAQLVGRSPAFRSMLDRMERVAGASTPVLLVGEPGTGKELVARTIHAMSPWRHGPFVVAQCGQVSPFDCERTLFGDVPGAGETTDRGLVGHAEGGTLFLDGVEALAPAAQGRILRLIETEARWTDPVASGAPDRLRVVCATEEGLEDALAAGRFRADLRAALSAFPIELPPLRQRREDVPLLAESLLRRLACVRHGRSLAPETLAVLERYDFPGNVRELGSILEHACLACDGDVIRPENLPAECRAPRPDGLLRFRGRVLPLAEAERRYLAWALESCSGDRASAARQVGISVRSLNRRLRSR